MNTDDRVYLKSIYPNDLVVNACYNGTTCFQISSHYISTQNDILMLEFRILYQNWKFDYLKIDYLLQSKLFLIHQQHLYPVFQQQVKVFQSSTNCYISIPQFFPQKLRFQFAHNNFITIFEDNIYPIQQQFDSLITVQNNNKQYILSAHNFQINSLFFIQPKQNLETERAILVRCKNQDCEYTSDKDIIEDTQYSQSIISFENKVMIYNQRLLTSSYYVIYQFDRFENFTTTMFQVGKNPKLRLKFDATDILITGGLVVVSVIFATVYNKTMQRSRFVPHDYEN